MGLVKWWNDRNSIELFSISILTMFICFITILLIDNLFGLGLIIIELMIAVKYIKPRGVKFINYYFSSEHD